MIDINASGDFARHPLRGQDPAYVDARSMRVNDWIRSCPTPKVSRRTQLSPSMASHGPARWKLSRVDDPHQFASQSRQIRLQFFAFLACPSPREILADFLLFSLPLWIIIKPVFCGGRPLTPKLGL